MQATNPWKADDDRRRARARLDGTSKRSVLVVPEMRSVEVVVVEELAEQLLQVALAQDDDVVEQLPPDGGDEALGDAVLPRAPVASPDARDVHGPEQRDDLGGEIESRSKTR
jgi:hypothetical protein